MLLTFLYFQSGCCPGTPLIDGMPCFKLDIVSAPWGNWRDVTSTIIGCAVSTAIRVTDMNLFTEVDIRIGQFIIFYSFYPLPAFFLWY